MLRLLSMQRHSSNKTLLVSDEAKKFSNIYIRCQCYETFFLCCWQRGQIRFLCLCLYLAIPFQSSLTFAGSNRSLPKKEASDASFFGKLLVLPANVRLDWKGIARYKHSGLLGLIISNEGKKFYNIDIRCHCYKTIFLHHWWWGPII